MTRLQELRAAAGMTQTELATAAGITVGVLREYEYDRRPITGARAITAYRIAQALGCTVEDLVAERDIQAVTKSEV